MAAQARGRSVPRPFLQCLTSFPHGDTLYVQPIWGNRMIKRLTKHGNSLALVIDRGVLDLLKIDNETPLEVTTDGSVLVVTPVRDEERAARFKQALDSTNRRYGRALKKLAE